jgi:hypothetical protein
MRTGSIAVAEPEGDLAAPPRQFRWEPVAGAARYEVTVMEVDRAVLWKSATGATSLETPAKLKAGMVPRKTLLWQVSAFGAAGERLASSDAIRFRILHP